MEPGAILVSDCDGRVGEERAAGVFPDPEWNELLPGLKSSTFIPPISWGAKEYMHAIAVSLSFLAAPDGYARIDREYMQYGKP